MVFCKNKYTPSISFSQGVFYALLFQSANNCSTWMKQVDITISKNQALQILYLGYSV